MFTLNVISPTVLLQLLLFLPHAVFSVQITAAFLISTCTALQVCRENTLI